MSDREHQPNTPGAIGGLIAWLLLVALLLTPTIFALIGTRGAVRTAYAQFWPTVPGRLLDGRVEIDTFEGTEYYLSVRYEYSVDGRKYTGRRWSPSRTRLTLAGEAEGESRLNALRSRGLRVRYNPLAPGDAAISTEPDEWTFLAFCWGWGFTVIAAGLLRSLSILAVDSLVARWFPAPQPPSPVPFAWRQFGVRNKGRLFVIKLRRECSFTAGMPVGITMIGVGISGFIPVFTPLPGGWWQWAAFAGAVYCSLRRQGVLRPTESYIIDPSRRLVLHRIGRREELAARFEEVREASLVRWEMRGDRTLMRLLLLRSKLPGVADGHCPGDVLARLDLSLLPDGITDHLVGRVADALGVAMTIRDDAIGPPPELGRSLERLDTWDEIGLSFLLLVFGLAFVALGVAGSAPMARGLGSGAPVLDLRFLFGALAFVGIGAFIALRAAPALLTFVRFGRPRISVAPVVIRPGDHFLVRYSRPILLPVNIEGGDVSLLVREVITVERGGETQTEDRNQAVMAIPLEGNRYRAGDQLHFEHSMQIPPEGLSGFGLGDHPARWVISLRFRLAGYQEIGEEYELTVTE